MSRRTLKGGPLSFANWYNSFNAKRQLTEEISEMRKWALQETVVELQKFARVEWLTGNPERLIPLLNWVATDLLQRKRGLESLAPPSCERKVLTQIHDHLEKAKRLLDENWHPTASIMMQFGSDREFLNALLYLGDLVPAAQAALESHRPTVQTLLGRPSSNVAILAFLYHLREVMMALGHRKVALRKTDCALLRVARPLYMYATGEEAKDGAFDRQIQELVNIPPSSLVSSPNRTVKGRRDSNPEADPQAHVFHHRYN